MTTRPRTTRARTWATVLGALALAASTALVAVTPTGAANTASEALVDTDDDGIADSREFAGSNRYKTSLALAERLVDNFGAVDTVFVASGVSLVDAVASSGLAGRLEAAILLTAPTRLNTDVAEFITENGVGTVYVLGGTAAVTEDVEEALEALEPVQAVKRLSGADRYETAVALATEIGGGSSWCGSDLHTAMLTNGAGDNFVNAVVAGPVAATLNLPVLLTDGESLSEATSAYIETNAIEQIIIVGGTDDVSEEVSQNLTAVHGVSEVQRIAGETDAGTAVAMAEVITGCADEINVDFSTVALVNRDATADGVTAAPVLASGIDARGTTPLLLVDDRSVLPDATEAYLESTPDTRDGERTHLSIVAIGGTAVVSEAAMAAAVEAADGGGAIGVEITSGDPDDEGRSSFVLLFDSDIDTAKVSNKALYRIIEPDSSAGRRLFTTETVEVGYRRVTINSVDPPGFAPGTKLQVLGGVQVGASGDQRTLMESAFALPALPRDTRSPVFRIAAFAGTETFYILLDEENLAAEEALTADEILIERSADTPPTITQINESTVRTGLFAIQTGAALAAGDDISIVKDAVRDESGRQNLRVRYVVPELSEVLRVTSVAVGPANREVAQASVALFDDEVVVTAKSGGIAGGASGNGWRVVGYDDRPAGFDKSAAPDVTVTVFDRSPGLIQYEINDGSGNVTQAELAAALEGHSEFAANFEISFGTDFENGVAHPTTTTNVSGELQAATLEGGSSAVAVRISTNAAISALAVGTGTCGAAELHLPDGCSATQLGASFVAAAPPAGVELSHVSRFESATQRAVVVVYTSNSEAVMPVAGAAYSIDAEVADGYGIDVKNDAATGRLRRDYRLQAE